MHESVARKSVIGFEFERGLKFFPGTREQTLRKINAAEIVVGEMAGLIARSFEGTFEPGNGFVEAIERDEIGADVVIRIAEIGIDFDGALAFVDGFLNFSLEMERPAKECVSFSSGMDGQGLLIKADGVIIIAFHLGAIGFFEDFPGARETVGRHHKKSGSTRMKCCQTMMGDPN